MGARCERPNLPVRRPGPGTPVTVVGLARSGAAAARWLLKMGCQVRVSEAADRPELQETARELMAAGAAVEWGKHSRSFIEGSALLIVSPGVPAESKPVRWAAASGIPVVGELELGSWYCPGRMVAITGSNGKSTVATLVGEILAAAGREAAVCGNIGRPLCGELERIRPATLVVLEVSSFQLETSLAFHSEIASILNLTENHLDRHGSLARYRETKARLFDFQKPDGWALLNADDPGSAGFRERVRAHVAFFSRKRKVVGACLQGDRLTLNLPALSGTICSRGELPKIGAHHEENALAAAGLAGLLGVPPEISGQVLKSFQGLPHRQQLVATVKGITFVNDSKSTTVASGLRAIEAAPGRVVLIAGGRDKGSDFRRLKACASKLKAVVLIGEDGDRIGSALKGVIPLRKARDLDEAVELAFELARARDCVLLSPMCASFDMFRDFEERGERFSEAVQELAACGT